MKLNACHPEQAWVWGLMHNVTPLTIWTEALTALFETAGREASGCSKYPLGRVTMTGLTLANMIIIVRIVGLGAVVCDHSIGPGSCSWTNAGLHACKCFLCRVGLCGTATPRVYQHLVFADLFSWISSGSIDRHVDSQSYPWYSRLLA